MESTDIVAKSRVDIEKKVFICENSVVTKDIRSRKYSLKIVVNYKN